MNLEMMKTIASVIVSSGTGLVVSQACEHVRPANLNRIGKVASAIGAFAIGCFVSDRVTAYSDEKIDEVIDKIQNNVEVEAESEETVEEA